MKTEIINYINYCTLEGFHYYQYVHVYKVRTEQEPLSSRFLYSITTIFYNIFLKFPHNHSYHSNGQPEFLPPLKLAYSWLWVAM